MTPSSSLVLVAVAWWPLDKSGDGAGEGAARRPLDSCLPVSLLWRTQCSDPPSVPWPTHSLLKPHSSQRVGAKKGGGVDSILKRRFLENLEVKVLTSLLMSRAWEKGVSASIMGCFIPDRMSCVVRMVSKANHIELVEAQLRHTPSQLKISTPGTEPSAMSLLIVLSPVQYHTQRWLSKNP